MFHVLLIEDHLPMARMLEKVLSRRGYRVHWAPDLPQAREILQAEAVDLVVTDLRLPSGDGLQVLRMVREQSPLIPVVLMTAYGTIETAVQAIREGAFDFIPKPFEPEHLLLVLERALEGRRWLASREIRAIQGGPVLIGESPRFLEALEQARKVAGSLTTVLLLGESGTGKELFARWIHAHSPLRRGPFVAVNCAAIPKDLLESELFGHERGAFTGAVERKPGRFEMAHQGTLFLDEIGELDLHLQAKLLRVLQGEPFERVGGTHPIRVRVRIIAATNRDLEEAVRVGTFREDLYYRIQVFPIVLPPLRERREDIPLLAHHFLDQHRKALKKQIQGFSPAALELLCQSPWKGNIRELANCIERACILCDGPEILPEHLGWTPRGEGDPPPSPEGLHEVAAAAARAAEIRYIRRVLTETRGNKAEAARRLRVSYKTLLTKIREYGME